MIYIIAFLLLILVIANETARNILFALLVGALVLAIAGAVIFAIILLIVWLFSLDISFSTPKVLEEALGYVLVICAIGGLAAIIYDQYRMRKK